MTVYMIQAGDGGPVKIGRSADPEKRCREIQTGHHERLRVIRTMEGGSAMEKALHSHYAHMRQHGEWFHFCPTMTFIELGKIEEPPARESVDSALSRWLEENDRTLAEFGKDVGGVEESTVARWRDGVIFPSPQNIRRIEFVTGGLVTYLDFQVARERNGMPKPKRRAGAVGR